MKLLRRWTTPDRLMMTKIDDRRWFDEPMPRVTIVTDRAHFTGLVGRKSLAEAGYRYLERQAELRAHRFVRGWWLWMIHRAGCRIWRFSIQAQYWCESPLGTPWPRF